MFLMLKLDGSAGKESVCNAGDTGDIGLLPRLRTSFKTSSTSRVSKSAIHSERMRNEPQEFREKQGSGDQHCSKVKVLKLNPSQLYYTFSRE